MEHDVILSGWGDPTGFGLGGAVSETYNFRGIFSEDGEYTLTLKLIDRDDSDKVIASTTKAIKIGEEIVVEEPEEELPEELPQTGIDVYSIASIIVITLLLAYVIINKKQH